MALSLESIARGVEAKPPIMMIYGVGGIGKTTLCAYAPDPVFVRSEDGIGNLDVAKFPVAQTFGEIMDAITVIAEGGHDFKTVVLDSADWTENLIWKQVAADQNIKHIEDMGYGKGYVAALDYWREYLNALAYLRDSLGMSVIQIAHSNVKRFDAPDADSYDRYQIKMHDKASALLIEAMDVVLFANYVVATRAKDQGFKKERVRAVGSGERRLWTSERPSHIAKNRYSMPDEIPLVAPPDTASNEDRDAAHRENWSRIARFIPYFNASKSEDRTNG